MRIHAIRDDSTTFDIQAALASPELRQFKSLMSRADINPVGKMTVADVDRRLTAAEVPLGSRLALKIALVRAGILV
jgi:hypothetical protein